ncbi:LamG domain-containing protein [Nitrincola iocasae]|uniref:LamG domain-containing protein n=1 Tax=Nitrincola iocasae TaxID=2614693 RepID=A0A5J6LAZ1_9GAMM|nr:LamG domain-containing protein [Nitrincola iocasae]QEW05660.1 LamG domain-containing protein [Nitrincola iocasae]
MSEISILDPAHPNLVAYSSMTGITDTQLALDVGDITATLTNATQVTDIVGHALQVNENGAADLGNVFDDLVSAPGALFSIGFFVRGSNLDNLFTKLGDSNHNENSRQFTIRTVNGYVGMLWYGNLGGTSLRDVRATEAPINDNEVYHVGIAYNGASNTNNGLDRVTIRINGHEVAKTMAISYGNFPEIIPSGPARVGIGAALGSTGIAKYSSVAIFDELRIYNTLLTHAEWQELVEVKYPYFLAGSVEKNSQPYLTQVRLYDAATAQLIAIVNTDADGNYQKALPTDDPIYVFPDPPSGYKPLAHAPIIPVLRNL